MNLKSALWAYIVSTKKSIGTSPFHLVYGTDVVFPTSFGIQVLNFLQSQEEEPNSMHNRINHLIELQEIRVDVYHKSQIFQEKMKDIFDRKVKEDDFHPRDLFLKWESRIEDKGKHGKFDHLWKGPYQIVAYSGNNAYILKEVNGDLLKRGPLNWRCLKLYYTQ